MKIKNIILSLVALAGSAQGAVTLQFSTTSVFATNFANGAGVGGTQMVWGIIVDAAGNGFNTTAYNPGFTVAGNLGTGTLIGADDVLYMAPAVMTLTTNTNDGAEVGMNRVTTLTSLVMSGLVNTGDAFAVVWLDKTAFGGTVVGGDKFGFVTNAAFVLPADTATVNLSAPFTGPDPLKAMTGTFGVIPEPSTALLGLLGVLGLVRRRR
jgi:hypothetical protein